jgi:type III secretion system YscQ/HrcQ family protein
MASQLRYRTRRTPGMSNTMYTPYPFERLPKLTRAQVRASTQLYSLFSDTDLALAQHEIETLLGLSLACSAGTPAACFGRDVAARSHAVWIELLALDASVGPRFAWLELPVGLCELAIDRVLGGEAELGILAPNSEVDEVGLGALAYLAARVCAAAGPRFRVHAIRAGVSPLGDTALVEVPLTIATRHEAAVAHFYAPLLQAHEASAASAMRPKVRALPALSLALWADAGHAVLDVATLRSLGVGDVVVLQRTSLSRAHAAAEFQGAVDVRVEGSATVLHCALRDGRLEVETIACSAESSMTSGRRIPDSTSTPPSERSTETLERAGQGTQHADLARDAPIEIGLEIARFQLRLGELEQVTPGDVLATGRRIGETVTLRAANQPFAEGELVDVEGELGVRITKILVP